MLKPLSAFLALFFAIGLPLPSSATEWPTRPVRIVVPLAAGGSVDLLARVLGDFLARRTGQSFVVENKPGASTTIGMENVARSTPDGYTLLLNASGAHSLNPAVMTMRFDPMVDVPPLMVVAAVQSVFVTSPDRKITDLAQFVAWAEANPTKVSFGAPGTGTANHLLGELLRRAANIDGVHVPYSGGGPLATAVMAGDISIASADLPAVLPLIQSGKLVALGVSSSKRSPFLPNIKTNAEQGYPGVVTSSVYGLATPKGVPSEVLAKIIVDVNAALGDPAVRDRLKTMGLVPQASTAAEYVDLLRADTARLAPLAQEMGIRVN